MKLSHITYSDFQVQTFSPSVFWSSAFSPTSPSWSFCRVFSACFSSASFQGSYAHVLAVSFPFTSILIPFRNRRPPFGWPRSFSWIFRSFWDPRSLLRPWIPKEIPLLLLRFLSFGLSPSIFQAYIQATYYQQMEINEAVEIFLVNITQPEAKHCYLRSHKSTKAVQTHVLSAYSTALDLDQ